MHLVHKKPTGQRKQQHYPPYYSFDSHIVVFLSHDISFTPPPRIHFPDINKTSPNVEIVTLPTLRDVMFTFVYEACSN